MRNRRNFHKVKLDFAYRMEKKQIESLKLQMNPKLFSIEISKKRFQSSLLSYILSFPSYI